MTKEMEIKFKLATDVRLLAQERARLIIESKKRQCENMRKVWQQICKRIQNMFLHMQRVNG